MSELKSWDVQKTNIVYLDGKPIEVKTLSEEIKFHIETYDRFKQEIAQLLYEQDKLKSALEAKNSRIQQMIRDYLKPKKTVSNGTGEADDTRKE